MLAYKDLTRGTAVPVSARRVNAGLARARVIEDSRRPRVVSVTELEDKLKDRERRAAVLKHELVAPSVSEVWNEPGLGGDGGSMKIVLSSSSIIAARKQQRRCSMTRLILASLVLAISILPLYAQSTSLRTDRSGYTTGTDGSRTVSPTLISTAIRQAGLAVSTSALITTATAERRVRSATSTYPHTKMATATPRVSSAEIE